MKLNIIAIGKLSKEYQTLFNKYKKRTNIYCDINIVEIKENKNKNINIKKTNETMAIIKKIPKGSKVICCSLNGKIKSSKEFTKIFNEDNVTFIIGGSNGICEKQFKEKISFSKMTFPHQMFRIMLMEQIYRSFSIKNNLKYHK
jgi:23S rRNA (pseudouridine1915-N3)-methyltransferase